MKFEKIKSTLYKAQGKNGTFTIKKSSNLWWASYINNNTFKTFRFPPRKSLKDSKEMCMENDYWEE